MAHRNRKNKPHYSDTFLAGDPSASSSGTPLAPEFVPESQSKRVSQQMHAPPSRQHIPHPPPPPEVYLAPAAARIIHTNLMFGMASRCIGGILTQSGWPPHALRPI